MALIVGTRGRMLSHHLELFGPVSPLKPRKFAIEKCDLTPTTRANQQTISLRQRHWGKKRNHQVSDHMALRRYRGGGSWLYRGQMSTKCCPAPPGRVCMIGENCLGINGLIQCNRTSESSQEISSRKTQHMQASLNPQLAQSNTMHI